MDHIALLGELDLGIERRRRLGKDRLVGRPTASSNRPAAAVKHAQRASMAGDDGRDRLVGPIERPGRAQVADLFIAVRVAKHHFLHAASPVKLPDVHRIAQEGVDGGRGLLQRIEPLEEGDDIDLAPGSIGLELVQAGDPGQEERIEDVVRGFGHAEDEGPGGARCGTLRLRHGGQRGQQVAGLRRPAGGVERNRWRPEGGRPALIVGGAEPSEDFRRGGFDDRTVLPDVEPGADEAEHPHLTAQTEQVAIRNRAAAVAAKTRVENIEVGDQVVCRRIGGRFPVQGGTQPAPDE